MRVVLDTNVLISATTTPEGTPSKILRKVYEGSLELVFSPSTLAELRRVLGYPKLVKRLQKPGMEYTDVDDVIQRVSAFSVFVSGGTKIDAVRDDPSDNMFLACAVEGNADFIVSGDRHLLELGEYGGIRILPPAQFAKIIGITS
ncbi:MAG: putative toxin-antitoxin system toxin component, PIN family [Deltaproteobacteria bacterium]|nr:putative toxin-antitoxin system toxin component, PIN family [Deltaproteobacteria bacterium]